uniref:Uncharacterized protein n=1 Tax=Sinocyclocheilus anshuiensis TaxID=1608454 RepID=A0A671LUU0_9TELE
MFMSWDFIVPVCSDDLVKSGAVNQYVVQEVLSIKQLNSHINSFKAALRSQGPLCILEHFDTAYSVLHDGVLPLAGAVRNSKPWLKPFSLSSQFSTD